jgi:hypothetical protein
MLDTAHVVDIPKGAVVRSNRVVLWTTSKSYDKGRGFNTDTRRQIGKSLEGERTRMYPNDVFKDLFPEAYAAACGGAVSPSEISVGLYAVTRRIAESHGMIAMLESACGKAAADQVLDYAMYSVWQASNVAERYEPRMRAALLFSERARSDSGLSSFFHDDLPLEAVDAFREAWAVQVSGTAGLDGVYLNVDGTNNDCASSEGGMAEKGKSKSGNDVGQVNTMYAVTDDGTPVTFDVYRGSVVDTTEFKYISAFLGKLGLKVKGCCLDRGFCDKRSVTSLREYGYETVVKLKGNTLGYRTALSELRESVKADSRNWLMDDGDIFGATREEVLFGGDEHPSSVHIFYDPANGSDRVVTLMRKIRKAKRNAEKALASKREPEIPAELKPYIHLRAGRGPRTLVVEHDAIQEAFDSKGYFGLGTTARMEASEAYRIYKLRDSSEKQFMVMKTQLGGHCYRVSSDDSIRARQFVAFVAGIIRNYIRLACRSVEEDSEDVLVIPTNEAIDSLQKIKLRRLPGNEYALVRNLSKRDDKLLSALGVNQKYIEDIAVEVNKRYQDKAKVRASR